MIDNKPHYSCQHMFGSDNTIEKDDSGQLEANDIKDIDRNPMMWVGHVDDMPRQVVSECIKQPVKTIRDEQIAQ